MGKEGQRDKENQGVMTKVTRTADNGTQMEYANEITS